MSSLYETLPVLLKVLSVLGTFSVFKFVVLVKAPEKLLAKLGTLDK